MMEKQIQEFLDHLVAEKGSSENTVAAYRNDLQQFRAFLTQPDQLGDEGLVWGVTAAALPLAPGEEITLTVGDAYFWAEYSHVDWPLPPGTPVYAQVDSAGEGAYGGVLEVHEIRGEPYNNIAGPVYAMPGLGRAAPVADSPAFRLHLPPR